MDPVATLFLIFFAVIFVSILLILPANLKEREKRLRLQEVEAKNLAREKALYAEILRKENIPDSAVKIFILHHLVSLNSDSLIKVPAFLWREDDQYIVLPLTPNVLKLYLDKRYTQSIELGHPEHAITYDGPFKEQFSDVCVDHYRSGDSKHHKNYKFGSMLINSTSARAIAHNFGLQFSVRRPSIYNELDLARSLLADQIITEDTYERLKEAYLIRELKRYKEISSRQSLLYDFMAKDLISRNDVEYWTHWSPDNSED